MSSLISATARDRRIYFMGDIFHVYTVYMTAEDSLCKFLQLIAVITGVRIIEPITGITDWEYW